MPIRGKEVSSPLAECSKYFQRKVAKVPEDEISGASKLKDIGRGSLIVSGKATYTQMEVALREQLMDELDLHGSTSLSRLV